MILALKRDKGFINLIKTSDDFEDNWNIVHVSKEWLEHNNMPSEPIDKHMDLYFVCDRYFKDVNKFLSRIEIPNKRVQTDISGTSKLIRSKDRTRIEIAYRRKNKKGLIESYATSPSTCYIDNEHRGWFFKDVDRCGGPSVDCRGNNHYILTKNDGEVFEAWSRHMDEEYSRLSGIKISQHRQKTIIKDPSDTWRHSANYLYHLLMHMSDTQTYQLLSTSASDVCKVELRERSYLIWNRDGFYLGDWSIDKKRDIFSKLISNMTEKEICILIIKFLTEVKLNENN